MKKLELIEAIASDAGITIEKAGLVLKSLLSNVEKTMQKGEKVTIVGFGTWSVLERKARTGRNPRTGMPIEVPSKKTVKFKAGNELVKNIGN